MYTFRVKLPYQGFRSKSKVSIFTATVPLGFSLVVTVPWTMKSLQRGSVNNLVEPGPSGKSPTRKPEKSSVSASTVTGAPFPLRRRSRSHSHVSSAAPYSSMKTKSRTVPALSLYVH